MKLTFLNKAVTLLVINSGSFSLVGSTTSEGASLDEGRSVRHLINASTLVNEGVFFDAFDGEWTSLQIQNTRLDQDDAHDLIRVILAEIFDTIVLNLKCLTVLTYSNIGGTLKLSWSNVIALIGVSVIDVFVASHTFLAGALDRQRILVALASLLGIVNGVLSALTWSVRSFK